MTDLKHVVEAVEVASRLSFNQPLVEAAKKLILNNPRLGGLIGLSKATGLSVADLAATDMIVNLLPHNEKVDNNQSQNQRPVHNNKHNNQAKN